VAQGGGFAEGSKLDAARRSDCVLASLAPYHSSYCVQTDCRPVASFQHSDVARHRELQFAFVIARQGRDVAKDFLRVAEANFGGELREPFHLHPSVLADREASGQVRETQATNTLSLADQAVGEIIRNAYSNLTLSQQATCSAVRYATANSALTLDDAAGGVGSFVVSAENTLGLGVQATRATVILGEASSAISLGQQAVRNLSRVVSASDVLAFLGSASRR